MQKARVTVTVRRQILARAERQVKRGRAKSVSAWVDSAMEEKARREDLATLLARRHSAKIVTSDPEDLKRIDPTLELVRC